MNKIKDLTTRTYLTSSTIYTDRFTIALIQPDQNLIKTLHSFLDTIPDSATALSIDLCVSELLRFHNPNLPMPFTPKELIAMQEETKL